MAIRVLFICTLVAAIVVPGARAVAGAYGTGNPPSRFSNAHHLDRSADALYGSPAPGGHDPCAGPRYRPGIDAHGRPVTDADLPGAEPLIHRIPRFGLLHDLPSGPWRPKRAEVGVIDVDPETGAVALDGLPLNPGQAPPYECGGGPAAGGGPPVPLK